MQMMHDMKISAKRDEILAALRKNRESHAQIVAEARVGYVEKAKQALAARLHELSEGKMVALTFRLTPPQDHTKTYDTAIRMMELHTEETLVLTAQQVRNLIQDEWDWKQAWLTGNSRYSKLASDQLGADDVPADF